MAIAGDLRLYAALPPSSMNLLRTNSPPPLKVNFRNFVKGGSCSYETVPKWSASISRARGQNTTCHSNRPLGVIRDYEMSTTTTINHDNQSFLFDAINMSLLERLTLAWKIIFPSPSMIRNSNANIAKKRLKMILFSDRCAVSDEAKQKIVSNVVNTLSDFVVIEPEEKVQLSISTDSALGTVYSVTVPVRRVRSEYQEEDEAGTIVNVEYKDTGVVSGSVDVKFDFYVHGE